MTLSADLLAILVCPEDKEPLYYVEDEAVLFNPRLCRTYPIRDDIPVLLIDEATALDDARCEFLTGLVDERSLEPTGSPT